MAERIAIRQDRCMRVPPDTPVLEAAAFLFAYATAYHALRDVGQLRLGKSLLVLGAAGGVGSATLEPGRALGARVFAAVSSVRKLDFALANGASKGLVYPADLGSLEDQRKLAKDLKALVGSEGCDLVLDPVGGAYSEAALRALGRHGRHLVVGFTAGIPRMPLNLALLKSCSIIGVDWRSFAIAERAVYEQNISSLLALWREGRICPQVTEVFPMEKAPEAIAQLEQRKALGKIVVTVSELKTSPRGIGTLAR